MKPTETKQRLEKNVEIGTLCAYYGSLLTDKQREALRLHYEEDLSLGEIAEQFGVSRQNVHELITRSAQKLQRYENELGGARKTACLLRSLHRISELLTIAQAKKSLSEAENALAQAILLIEQTIIQQEGEENDNGL